MKRLSEQTLYEILEVPANASRATIAAAVQRARTLYGPGSLATYTLMSDDEAALLSRRIDEAASTLLDEQGRARYDAGLLAAEPGAGRPADAGRSADAGRGPPVIPAVRMVPPQRREAEPSLAASRGGEEVDPLDPTGDGDAPSPAWERTGARLQSPQPPPGAPPAARPPILLSREVSAPTPTPAPPTRLTPTPPTSHTPAPPTPTPTGSRAATPAAPGQAAPVPDSTSWTGEVLRRLREARGITLEQLSVRIKVTRHHIENIEADRFSALPAPVYLRGILLSMARELRLDGQKVARSYLERVASSGGAGTGQKPR